MDKRQFWEETIDAVRMLSAEKVIGGYMDLPRRSGHNYLGYCPFHNDTNLGSFVVTPKKNIFKCFACGAVGDSIKFVSMQRGINYLEAAFEIALREGIINISDYEEYFKKRRVTSDEASKIERLYIEKDADKHASKIADEDTLHVVFQKFVEMHRLSPEHSEYLRNERKLSDETILEREYFTMVKKPFKPKDEAEMDKYKKDLVRYNEYQVKTYAFKKALLELGMDEEVLKEIPGFYMYKYKRDGEDHWAWTYAENSGIGIPIKNAKGKIVGIQVRRDKKDENQGRYFWFSSTFANYENRTAYGTSAGAPIDVVYPCDKPNRILFVTEGRFKSEVIASKIGSVSVSVQGVGNWKGIEKEIKTIESQVSKRYGIKDFSFKRVYIAFDSDMSYKYQVYTQLEQMSSFLTEKFSDKSVYYAHWTGDYKGIDDLLTNSSCSTPKECGSLITIYEKEEWDIPYQKEVKRLMIEAGVESPMNLDSELLKSIQIKKKL